MIEILVVIAIIVILVGILLPTIGLARNSVRKTETRQLVSALRTAFDLYRAEDGQKRYPSVRADDGIHRDLLEQLDERGMWSGGARSLDAAGLLLDPWGQTYHYRLARPTPSAGADRLAAWNWDADAGRESRWGQRRDSGTGTTVEGPLPYPYLWSLGPQGTIDDAGTWIVSEDGP